MRLFLATFIALLGLSVSGLASVDFSGTWVLDLKASDSPDAMLKRMGASALERKFAASTKLESTYRQSRNLLTITTRGPLFSRTEHLRLDGAPETKNENRAGPYTIRNVWSNHGKELISISAFRTKDDKNAELTVTRKLADNGNELVLTQRLKVEGESPQPVVRRIWRRKAYVPAGLPTGAAVSVAHFNLKASGPLGNSESLQPTSHQIDLYLHRTSATLGRRRGLSGNESS